MMRHGKNLWWYPPLRWTGLRVYRSTRGGWYVLYRYFGWIGGVHFEKPEKVT